MCFVLQLHTYPGGIVEHRVATGFNEGTLQPSRYDYVYDDDDQAGDHENFEVRKNDKFQNFNYETFICFSFYYFHAIKLTFYFFAFQYQHFENEQMYNVTHPHPGTIY